MKIFKKFKRFVKTCLMIICIFLGANHLIQTISLSNEARAVLSLTEEEKDKACDFTVGSIKDAIIDQLQRNQEAQDRYERNRIEAVKHRAYLIEAKREELKRMEDLDFNMVGDPINDSITLMRYKIRQQRLRHDWGLGNYATEDEMMMLTDIRNKKIEGIPLTEEEMQFYAMMNGTNRELNKLKIEQEQEVNKIIQKQHAKEEAKANRSFIFQSKQDDLYKKRNTMKNQNIYETQEVSTDSLNVTSSTRGKRVVYTFQSQQDIIQCGGPYLSHIREKPDNYIIRIKNQRVNANQYKRLDQNVVDFINQQSLAITHTSPTYGDIELYFGKGGAEKNKISNMLKPIQPDAIETFNQPKVMLPRSQSQSNIFDKSKGFMESVNPKTKSVKPHKNLKEQHYDKKLKIIEKNPNYINYIKKAIDKVKY